jgi:predicted aspartyl protease
VNLNCLVDSGADVNYMAESIARKLGLDMV